MEKIIFLLNSPYPYYTGGRETWINNISNRLSDRYEIVIIAEDFINKDNPLSRWDIDSRVKIIHASSLLSYSATKWVVRSYINFFHCFYRSYKMYKLLCNEISLQQKTHIIAMDTVFLPLAYRKIKKKYPEVHTIISSRGRHAEVYSLYWPLMKRQIFNIEASNLASADCIWSNGYDTQEFLQKKGFKSTVIFNGVDCKHIFDDNMPPHEVIKRRDGVKLGTIGTLLDLKGYPTMIVAIKRAQELYPKIQMDLYAFGKGNSERYMKLAEKYGVEKNIHFLGEDKNAPLYVKQTDILLALGTSDGSGMSMAALEMLSTGLPVIATDIPCYQQLIENGKNGFLVKEGDYEELANCIYQVSQLSASELRKIQDEAQKRVLLYDWDHVEELVINGLK